MPENQYNCYNVENDPRTAENDKWAKHKVIARMATIVTMLVWVVTSTSYLFSKNPVPEIVFTTVSWVWLSVLAIHLLGVGVIDKVLEGVKYWRTPSLNDTVSLPKDSSTENRG